MKRTTRTLITAAAISGLLSGVAVNRASSADTNTAPGKVAPAKKMPKVHDCSGQNDCKGLGGCKNDDHKCKFKNDCKGKGACSITDKDIKNWEKMQKEKAAKGV
ncbi:MAG TPA: hypothetical protein VH413_15765 [Verrucomicrobiae bacterium]|nr:hypothetical protein [Verrucomicrobiae bacterium]